MQRKSNLEALMTQQIDLVRRAGSPIPPPQTEFRFHPTRKWRFDFAWPTPRIALEIEGLTYGGGARTTVCRACRGRKTVRGRRCPVCKGAGAEGGQGLGRHQTPVGYEGDCEKYNAAQRLGWIVVRATGGMVRDGRALSELEETFTVREPKRDGETS